ncbi:MAG: hypothetical protein LBQ94_07995, partial [Treponema sp.]|nr:hypothetical protein [Treponema sp.]
YLGKNADRAIADFTEVIRLPRNRYTTDAYFYRGMVYRNDKGDLDRTIADFEQLLLIDPNYENNGIKIREVLESFKQQRGR